MRDTGIPRNDGIEWLETDGPYADIVLSTRIRLARNLRDYRFGIRAEAADRKEILHRVRDAVAPLSLDELTRITEIWVDTAMQLSDKSLRVMERLVRAQLRRPDLAGEAGTALGSARSD